MSVLEVVQIASNATVAVVVPVLAWLAKKMIDQQVELLKARNDLLRETQFDRAVTIIQAQRTAHELALQHLESRIDLLQREGISASEELTAARTRLTVLSATIASFEKDAAAASREALIKATFNEDVRLVRWGLAHAIDFSECRFSGPVNLRDAQFSAGVNFSGADLRRANFDGAQLQGVDLSGALIDLNTKVPKVHYGSGVRF